MHIQASAGTLARATTKVPCPMTGGAERLSEADAECIDLLAATARRDRAAFRKLYASTSRQLYGTVLRILRDASAAQDVLQDVYLKIWERAEGYQSNHGAPIAWMTAIARNRAIDEIRSRQRRAGDSPFDETLSHADEPKSMVDHEAQHSLAHCLGHLEPEQRKCILLAYVHGYSREELAAGFSRPVNTIKTWLHRSLGQLKLCMERA